MRYLKIYEDFVSTNWKEIFPYQSGEIDPKKDFVLLLPGGDGDPDRDFKQIAPLLEKKYNLLSLRYNTTDAQFKAKDFIQSVSQELKQKIVDKRLNILGFSMGTTLGFWIIKALGESFKGKFVCVDAAAPGVGGPKDYIQGLISHNAPRRYTALNLPFYLYNLEHGELPLEKGEEASPHQQINWNYQYTPQVEKKISDNKIDLTIYKEDNYTFSGQSDYLSWRNKQELVIEFLDEPYKTGEGKHYPSEKNPSGIFIGQKNILPDWNSSENEDVESESIPEFLERIVKFSENMKGKKIDREKVLIVQDKNSHPDNKKYFFSKECDFAGLIEFAQKQADGLPGQLGRASKKDKLEGVSVLIVRAGRTGLKNLSKEECQSEAFSDEERVSTGDIKVVVLEGVEHFRICQEGSSQIVEESIEFFG